MCDSFLKAAVCSWDHHQLHTEQLLGSQYGTGCLQEGWGQWGNAGWDLMESENYPLSFQIPFPTSQDFCAEEINLKASTQ